jgi:5'-3' exonuclease
MNWLFIDGSYYVFYRYYALLIWWKNARKDEPLDNPIENPEFVDKFKKTFISKIDELKKKLKIPDAVVIVGKDCPRNTIWRMKYFKDYKGTRGNDNKFLGGPFFALAYQELFSKCNISSIIEHDTLEADDCIALYVHHILEKNPEDEIFIIASDHDYLQLKTTDNINIYDLKYKSLMEHKNVFLEHEQNLFCKIVMGDKSDNIPSIFPKCGIKTAIKCYDNKEYFNDKLKDKAILDNFNRNKKLVDFNEIPTNLKKGFYRKYINN